MREGLGPAIHSIYNTDGPMTSSTTNTIKDNMTEDNTFNALRKSSFEVVYGAWCIAPDDSDNSDDELDYSELAAIIEKHGWTYDEFWAEYYKRQL
jgi:hypothetical protein